MIARESTDGQEISGIDHAIDQVLEHWQNLRAAQIASADADAGASSSSDGDDTDSEETDADAPGQLTRGQKSRKALLDSLTPAELAAAQKRALLAQYGYVEEEGYDAGESGMGGSTLRRREEDKEAAERRALIDKAIREEGRRKRKSKRAKEQGGVMVRAWWVRAGCADGVIARVSQSRLDGAQLEQGQGPGQGPDGA